MRAMAVAERPIEIRPVEVRDPLRPRVADPHHRMWYRAIDQLPDDPALAAQAGPLLQAIHEGRRDVELTLVGEGNLAGLAR